MIRVSYVTDKGDIDFITGMLHWVNENWVFAILPSPHKALSKSAPSQEPCVSL